MQKCASCHQQTYKNWKMGPHANAFSKLFEFKDKINKHEKHFKTPFVKYMNTKIDNGHCYKCHATENIFETIYKEADIQVSYHESLNKKIVPRLQVRGKSGSRKLGVDCLTCHVKNGKVLTRESFKPQFKAGSTESCNPIPSKFFSSNQSCISCHIENVHDVRKFQANNPHKIETNCNECHMEKSKDGKTYSHYYYWNVDVGSGRRAQVLGGLFEAFKVAKKGGHLVFTWKNQIMPHKPAWFLEFYVKVKVKSQKKDVFSRTFVMNYRQHAIKKRLKQYFGEERHNIPGVDGTEFTPLEPGLNFKWKIPSQLKNNKLEVKLVGGTKTQFWLPDTFGKNVYFRYRTL